MFLFDAVSRRRPTLKGNKLVLAFSLCSLSGDFWVMFIIEFRLWVCACTFFWKQLALQKNGFMLDCKYHCDLRFLFMCLRVPCPNFPLISASQELEASAHQQGKSENRYDAIQWIVSCMRMHWVAIDDVQFSAIFLLLLNPRPWNWTLCECSLYQILSQLPQELPTLRESWQTIKSKVASQEGCGRGEREEESEGPIDEGSFESSDKRGTQTHW